MHCENSINKIVTTIDIINQFEETTPCCELNAKSQISNIK